MFLSQVQSLRAAVLFEELIHKVDLFKQTFIERKNKDNISTQEEDDLTKLIKDCEMITHHVSEMQNDLEETHICKHLLHLSEEQEQKRKDGEKKMDESNHQEKKDVYALHEELQQKTEKLKKLETISSSLTQTKLQHEEKKEQKIKTLDFLHEKKWQQTTWNLQEQLKVIQEKKENEIRAHEEAKTFLHQQLKELEQKLEDDRQHTSQELQEKKNQQLSVSRKNTLALDKLMEMQRKFREMENVITKDKREQHRLLELEKENKAATKIQAWWRGYVVRKGFKKAAGGKKGKKKK